MKQIGKQRWLLIMLAAILMMTLFALMAFATDRQTDDAGKGTDTLPGSGLVSDAESILDGIESGLTDTGTTKDTAKDTAKDTSTGTTSALDSLTGDVTDNPDTGGVGLVIGIGIAVVALIIVFVILSRSSGGKK